MPAFDPTAAVTEYRDVITWRDASVGVIERLEFQTVAGQMRERWKRWNGDDDLREVACDGPPEDDADSIA